MMIKTIGTRVFVISGVTVEQVKEVLDHSTIRICDEDGNQILAVDYEYGYNTPISRNAIVFNSDVDGNAAIEYAMPERIAKLPKAEKKKALIDMLLEPWDDIKMAEEAIKAGIERLKDARIDVSAAFAIAELDDIARNDVPNVSDESDASDAQ